MAECRRIDPNHVGPHCGCAGDACALDAPRPTTSELAADVEAAQSKVRSFIYGAFGKMGEDRVRPALAALDALVARITDLEAQVAALTETLRTARMGLEEIANPQTMKIGDNTAPRLSSQTIARRTLEAMDEAS